MKGLDVFACYVFARIGFVLNIAYLNITMIKCYTFYDNRSLLSIRPYMSVTVCDE